MVPYNFGEIATNAFNTSYQSALQRKFQEEEEAKQREHQRSMQEENLNAQFVSERMAEINARTMAQIANRHGLMSDRLRERFERRMTDKRLASAEYMQGAQLEVDKQLAAERNKLMRELAWRAEMVDAYNPVTGKVGRFHPETTTTPSRPITGGEYIPSPSGLARTRTYGTTTGGIPAGYTPMNPFGLQAYQMSSWGRNLQPPLRERESFADKLYGMLPSTGRDAERGDIIGVKWLLEQFGAGEVDQRYKEKMRLYEEWRNNPNWWAATFGLGYAPGSAQFYDHLAQLPRTGE